MKDSPYFKQAQLMLRTIPHVAAEERFALKGGTAINLFVRDMPRLSVDIDLTYVPVDEPRDAALDNINDALVRIATVIEAAIPGTQVQESREPESQRVTKLVVVGAQSRIKIEPNPVIRGSVFPTEERDLTPQAEDIFELSATARTVSIADLYGGKLCAALDRQHPRDLFDVKVLMENEGITDEIRKAFIVYLASHDRPINELLAPKQKNTRNVYNAEFVGMTEDATPYDELIATWERLVKTIHGELTEREKEFLLSLKMGEPDWSLLDIPGIDRLPAVQWKLQNIRRMRKEKHSEALRKLQAVLLK